MIQVGAKRRLDPQVAVGQRPELGVGLEQCLEMPPRLLGLRAHPGRGPSWEWGWSSAWRCLHDCWDSGPTQALLSAPFTEVVSPGTDPGVPHLHRPEVRVSKGHQDTRPLPKLEFYAKYK